MPKKTVIIGGVAGGATAAARLRRAHGVFHSRFCPHASRHPAEPSR